MKGQATQRNATRKGTKMTAIVVESIRAKHPVRNAFAGRSSGNGGRHYYETKGHGVNAFDNALQTYDLSFDRADCIDFSGDEGHKTLGILNEYNQTVGWAWISWYACVRSLRIFGYIAMTWFSVWPVIPAFSCAARTGFARSGSPGPARPVGRPARARAPPARASSTRPAHEATSTRGHDHEHRPAAGSPAARPGGRPVAGSPCCRPSPARLAGRPAAARPGWSPGPLARAPARPRARPPACRKFPKSFF